MPKGFAAVKQAREEQRAKDKEFQERRAASDSYRDGLPQQKPVWFKLADGDSAQVRFLEGGDEVAFYRVHNLIVPALQYGIDVPCVDEDNEGVPCPACEAGIPVGYKGWINLIWRDAPKFIRDDKGKVTQRFETDSDGNPVTEDTVAIWSSGRRLFETLDEEDEDYNDEGGITALDFTVKRTGLKTETTYRFKPLKVGGKIQIKPLSAADKKLAADKYDLIQWTKVPTYEELAAKLGQQSSNGNGNGGEDEGPRAVDSPFKPRNDKGSSFKGFEG